MLPGYPANPESPIKESDYACVTDLLLFSIYARLPLADHNVYVIVTVPSAKSPSHQNPFASANSQRTTTLETAAFTS
jgi:hypothetical protein